MAPLFLKGSAFAANLPAEPGGRDVGEDEIDDPVPRWSRDHNVGDYAAQQKQRAKDDRDRLASAGRDEHRAQHARERPQRMCEKRDDKIERP